MIHLTSEQQLQRLEDQLEDRREALMELGRVMYEILGTKDLANIITQYFGEPDLWVRNWFREVLIPSGEYMSKCLPPMPDDIIDTLSSYCPIHPGRLIKNTHFLMYTDCWVLITRDLIPDTKGKNFQIQELRLKELNQKTEINYQILDLTQWGAIARLNSSPHLKDFFKVKNYFGWNGSFSIDTPTWVRLSKKRNSVFRVDSYDEALILSELHANPEKIGMIAFREL